MKSILPIFTCLVFACASRELSAQSPVVVGNSRANVAPPAAAAPDASTAGDALLRQVLLSVDAQRSVIAKVRQKVELLGRQLVGSGFYLQQGRGPGRLLKLEMKLQGTTQVNSLRQICDGESLWIHENFGEREELSRVEIARVRQARPKSQPAATAPATWLALGGLPKLLLNLESSFKFGPVVESRLDALRVWTIEGAWEPVRLGELLPDQKEKIVAGEVVDTSKLAPNLPDRVVLQVGCDDLFPYRIEYWRSAPLDKDGKSSGRAKMLVVIELFEVQLGVPIDPRQFAYHPGDLVPTDRTQAFLEKLGLEEVVPAGANRNRPPRR